MTRTPLSQRLVAALAVLTPLFVMPSLSCTGGDGDGDGDGDGRPEGAILIAERFSTPDGRVGYMGAFPALPSEDVDVSQMIELGDGDAFACGGNAFFFDAEALAIRKYVVEDDLSLTEAESIQVGQEGITGWTGAHVCASSTSAFIIEGMGGRAVHWNPEEMVVIEGFDLPAPDVAEGLELQFFEPFMRDGLAYFPLAALNWDTLESERAVLAIFDPATKSVRYIYDDRCQNGLAGHVSGDGTFYRYQGYGAFFDEYATDPDVMPDCVLKMAPGSETFDASYALDIGPTNNMWAVDDHHAVAMVIDSSATWPTPENMWDWWALPIVPTLVDLETGEASPYEGLSNEAPMNGRKLALDGVSYFQLNTFDDEGNVSRTDLMRLTLDGAELVFRLQGGDFLTLERLW